MPLYRSELCDANYGPSSVCCCVACRFGQGGVCAGRPRRYPSDMSDAEWLVTEPLLPLAAWR